MTEDAQFSHAHQVRFTRNLPGPVPDVWSVLTETHRLPGWYGEGSIEGRVGGAVSLMEGHIKGVVTQWVPLKKLTYTWNVLMPGQTESDYPESYLSLELDRTSLTLTHLPALDAFVKMNAMGWHTFLDMVDAAVSGKTVEAREVYMRRNAERYGVDLSRPPG